MTKRVAVLVAAQVVLHLSVLTRYGYFRDELYYVASTRHLAWGYVDHPPLSIALLAAWTAVFGDSIAAIRVVPVVAGAAVALLAALLARALGGGRLAQALAALCVVAAPEFLGSQHVYSMNALDQLAWTATALLLVRLVAAPRPGLWLLLGAVLGLGLQNKISVLWLGAGIAAALLLTPMRAALRTRWPWLAAALALLAFAPYVAWQVAHGFPTLEFMRNATRLKMVAGAPLQFLGIQILTMNPATLPVWLGGLAWLLLDREGRRWRALAIVFLAVVAILLGAGTSKPSYLAPAFPMLFAAGAVAWERWAAHGVRRWARVALVALVAFSGLALAPLAIPLLSPDGYVAYTRALGLRPPDVERHERIELPQHFADMHGWDEMAEKVARAWNGLAPAERARCVIYGQNYGEAGAIDVLGRRRGLPGAVSGHNSYWFWGPGNPAADIVIIIGGEMEDHAGEFADLRQVETIECRRCMAYERGLGVFVGRGLKRPLGEIWPELREFI
ncbi:MAG: glycosyltransferase family 39 protein [Acidobacteria bacterium]|nr:glycosyltransferase family 39 protein [Acidobacteriota bacterium]